MCIFTDRVRNVVRGKVMLSVMCVLFIMRGSLSRDPLGQAGRLTPSFQWEEPVRKETPSLPVRRTSQEGGPYSRSLNPPPPCSMVGIPWNVNGRLSCLCVFVLVGNRIQCSNETRNLVMEIRQLKWFILPNYLHHLGWQFSNKASRKRSSHPEKCSASCPHYQTEGSFRDCKGKLLKTSWNWLRTWGCFRHSVKLLSKAARQDQKGKMKYKNQGRIQDLPEGHLHIIWYLLANCVKMNIVSAVGHSLPIYNPELSTNEIQNS